MAFDYDNQFETGEITCDFDGCANLETYDQSFVGCIAAAKDDGWRVIFRAGEFVHLCPSHRFEEI